MTEEQILKTYWSSSLGLSSDPGILSSLSKTRTTSVMSRTGLTGTTSSPEKSSLIPSAVAVHVPVTSLAAKSSGTTKTVSASSVSNTCLGRRSPTSTMRSTDPVLLQDTLLGEKTGGLKSKDLNEEARP